MTDQTPQLANRNPDRPTGLIPRIIETFVTGPLAMMLIMLAIVAGAMALTMTPREEEPQIVVPMADVMVHVPGADALEVERQVASRLEKLLYEIDGVEYVYSTSMPNRAVVTARFFVGEDREDSLIKLHNKLAMNADQVPPSVAGWVVKPVEIDDVPIVAITLYAPESDPAVTDSELLRVAEELELKLQTVENTGRTYLIGGRRMIVRVQLDAEQMAGRDVTFDDVQRALRGANVAVPAGDLQQLDQHVNVEAGTTLNHPDQVGELVVGVHKGLPVYLRDVAEVQLTPEEVESFVHLAMGPAAGAMAHPSEKPVESHPAWDQQAKAQPPAELHPAVTLAIAKRRGANAVWVSQNVQDKLAELAPTVLPDGVEYRITRDYGKTANDKFNELVEALAVAIVIVVGLLALVMGWREGLIVATAVPLTFALTLLINYLAGYTINRVTLFALILALGLVVDDPIVDVENIYRHLKMGLRKPLDAVLVAVNEVRPPIILATLAVIVSFVPMFFITGMMGPYMRPMALNVPLAMLMSLVVAFTVTPWMSYHVLKGLGRKWLGQQQGDAPGRSGAADSEGHDEPKSPEEQDAEAARLLRGTRLYRVYAAAVEPLLNSRSKALMLLVITAALFLASCGLVALRLVPLKMLPFDNKNEFQLVIDMPEGATLHQTAAATHALTRRLARSREVVDVTSYVGTASPMDFNAMVRQYYLRSGPHVADIRINLVAKRHRTMQSHAMTLRLRDDLKAIAAQHGANIKLVESPPGPPVVATLTVEIYGQAHHRYERIEQTARRVAQRFSHQPSVEDVDVSAPAPTTQQVFEVDKEKAALAGLTTQQVAQTLAAALDGQDVTLLHDPRQVRPMPVRLRLPRAARSDLTQLENLYLTTASGQMIQLGEIGRFVEQPYPTTIYHKNLRRVAYVFSEPVGIPPAEAIIDMIGDLTPGEPPVTDAGKAALASIQKTHPDATSIIPADMQIVWTGEGEWQITVDVFRDLGIAFGIAMLGIYVLLVYETRSYFMPLILMISIPLTVIGIMPGFWLLNVLTTGPVGGYGNPVFFTATAMIGMIALSGIAVRNAILLIDFIHAAVDRGETLRQAILDSGATRFRPIFLTAGTAMLAAAPITLDPIFSGLAWALIFGLFVSTAFTLVVIPTVYWLIYRPADA